MCRKEFVNGIEVEIAQTCECERFPASHVLTDSTYKYTGPRCDQRKLKFKYNISGTIFQDNKRKSIEVYCPFYSLCLQF